MPISFLSPMHDVNIIRFKRCLAGIWTYSTDTVLFHPLPLSDSRQNQFQNTSKPKFMYLYQLKLSWRNAITIFQSEIKKLCIWPYHSEYARFRLITEAKPRRPWLILFWDMLFISRIVAHLFERTNLFIDLPLLLYILIYNLCYALYSAFL